jgi:hypothetical protein
MADHSLAETTKRLKASLENAVPAKKVQQVATPPREQEVVAPLDLSKNVFAQNMSGETVEAQKAEFIRGKITFAFADPIKTRQEDVGVFNELLDEFEQYYSSLQDMSIETDQQSIKELTDRIQNSVAPEMRRMIDSLTSTNSRIATCSELLGVLKIARDLGKTIEELTAAIRASKETVEAKEKAESDLARLQSRLLTAQSLTALAQKNYNSAPRGWFGWGSPGVEFIAALRNAKSNESALQSSVLNMTDTIEGLKKKLEDTDAIVNDPRLKILRSFDMTHHGLQESITGAADDVISTVNAIRNSIRALVGRVVASEGAMKGIVDKIENTRIDRTVLISAFSEAYETNTKQIDEVSVKLDALQKDFDSAEKDSVEAGRIRVDLMKLSATHRAMLAYNQRLDTLLKIMQTSDAASVISANDADRVLQSVRNNRDGFNTLANQTLPSLSEAMRLVLHQFADEQDQEFRMAIGQVTGKLGETAKDTAKRALEQQEEFHKQKIDGITAIINRLDSASSLLGKSLEAQVRFSIEEQQSYDKVVTSANELRDGMDAAAEIHAQVKEHVRASGDKAAESLGLSPEPPPTEPSPTEPPAVDAAA